MIFLASPYRDPDPLVRAWRYARAVEFCAAHLQASTVWETDLKHRPIYSPIVHWHPVAERNALLHEEDTAFWMDLNRPMLEICDGLWVLALPGWRESKGVSAEIKLVKGFGRPVLRVLPTEHGHGHNWERIA